ncbi:MAG: hypothetical protein OXF62_19300 [Caldilineaceae bacterium]|nr:hypothetical protein [Caldilineaceae bacterium]
MRVPFIFFWQLKQEAEDRGMTLDEYLDSELERLAAKAKMSVEDYVEKVKSGEIGEDEGDR